MEYFKRVTVLLGVIIWAFTQVVSTAWAQVFPIDQFNVNVHGIPVYCTASTGQPVPFYFTNAAMASGGGHASMHPTFGASIRLAPATLNTIPPLSAVMVVFHECAHVALPMGIGLASPAQEFNADCYAIQTMANLNLVYDQATFNQAVAYVAGFSNGQARVAAMWNCLN